MSNDRPASGSRWEPTTADPDTVADAAPPASEPAPQGASSTGTTAALPAPTPPGRTPRGRAKIAAAAAGLLVLGGIGGFWLGHSTAAPAPGAGGGIGTHQHREHGGDGAGVQGPSDGTQSGTGAAA